MGASFAKKFTNLLFYVANYQPFHEIESFEKKWPHTFLPKIESEMNKYGNRDVTHISKRSCST